jgi:hypothetical protein
MHATGQHPCIHGPVYVFVNSSHHMLLFTAAAVEGSCRLHATPCSALKPSSMLIFTGKMQPTLHVQQRTTA